MTDHVPLHRPSDGSREYAIAGVTKVGVYCARGHQASIDVWSLPGDVAVPAMKDWLRCSKMRRQTDPNPTGPDAIPRTSARGAPREGTKPTKMKPAEAVAVDGTALN